VDISECISDASGNHVGTGDIERVIENRTVFDELNTLAKMAADQPKSLEIFLGVMGCKWGVKPLAWLSEPYRAY
jgi:hypothetical protein